MSEPDIGSYEREVLKALGEVGRGQRDLVEAQRRLTHQVEQLEEGLTEFRRNATSSLTGLSQRVVASETRLDALAPLVGALNETAATLSARADAGEQRAAALSSRPLALIAGGVVIVALAAVALVGLLAAALWRGVL